MEKSSIRSDARSTWWSSAAVDGLKGTKRMVFLVAGRKKALSEKRPCASVVSVTHTATLSDDTTMSIVPSVLAASAIANASLASGTRMSFGLTSCTMCSDTTAPCSFRTVEMTDVVLPGGLSDVNRAHQKISSASISPQYAWAQSRSVYAVRMPRHVARDGVA